MTTVLYNNNKRLQRLTFECWTFYSTVVPSHVVGRVRRAWVPVFSQTQKHVQHGNACSWNYKRD